MASSFTLASPNGILALALFGLASGCASQTAVLAGYTKPTVVPTFEISDMRPANERDTKFLSLSSSSCDYGVRQIGDKDIVPDRITLLRDDLNEQLSKELTHKRLVVTHYGVYFNVSNEARYAAYRAAAAQGGVLVLRGKPPIGSSCKQSEMTGGWYEPNEVTTSFSPFVVEITVVLDDQTLSIRSVYSTDKSLTPASGNPDTAAAAFRAIRKATNTLIYGLRQNLG